MQTRDNAIRDQFKETIANLEKELNLTEKKNLRAVTGVNG